MLKYETEKTHENKYRLYDTNTNETILLLEEVAICFTYSPGEERGIRGTLLKHGQPGMVKKYYDTAVRKFREVNCNELADEMRYIVGKFDVEELNKIIEITGYVGKFYEDLDGDNTRAH